nr:hypothetical protein [Sulfurifustis variabilis]
MATNENALLEKIRRLPPEKIKEVEDFVDFIGQSEGDDEKAFMRAVVQGLADLEAGRSVSLAEAKKRLGLS